MWNDVAMLFSGYQRLTQYGCRVSTGYLVHGWLSPLDLVKFYEKKDTQDDADV